MNTEIISNFCYSVQSRPTIWSCTVKDTANITHSSELYSGKVKEMYTLEQARGEQRYSCTLYLTSALDGGEKVVNAMPQTLYYQQKDMVPLYRRLGGP